MQKRDEKILDCLHKEIIRITPNLDKSDISYENIILSLGMMDEEERLKYYKNLTEIAVLYNYLVTRKIIFFGFTNMFKLFSDVLKNLDIDPTLVARFLLSLVEEYPNQLLNFDEEKTHDYIILMKEFLGDFFSSFDFEDLCRGNATTIHEVVKANREYIIYKVREKNLNIYYNMKEINDAVRKIRASYSENKNGFTKEDIQTVYASFIRLHVSHIYAKEIKNILTNRYNKKMKNTFSTKSSHRYSQPQTSLITDKEYKTILKEIRKSYNPYTRELTEEEMTEEKREYITYLMVKVEMDQSVISDFLNKTEMVEKTYTYDYFKDHMEEFEFYFGEELEQVKAYKEEIKSCASDEDKEYWIMGINEELAKLKYSNKLASYEYETKLLKDRKDNHEEI